MTYTHFDDEIDGEPGEGVPKGVWVMIGVVALAVIIKFICS